MQEREDWITRYLELTSDTEPTELLRLWCGLSGIAAVLQRKCYTELADFPLYPNLYVLLIALPAMRKTYSMKFVKRMLADIGIEATAAKTTLEGLIDTITRTKILYADDSGSMEFHSSVNLFCDEFGVLLKQRHSNLMTELCDWFDCPDIWPYKTKTGGEAKAINVWINILGATTPDTIIREMLDEGGAGLMSRFIGVYADKVQYKSEPIVDQALKTQLTNELEIIGQLGGEFIKTPDFKKRYNPWYEKQSEIKMFDGISQLTGYPGRRALHLLKLCMISSASRGNSMQLDVCDFDRALKILEITEEQMVKIFDTKGTGKHKDVMRKIIILIQQSGDVGIRKSTLLSHFKEDITSWHLENIMTTLIGAKLVSANINLSDSDTLYKNIAKD